MSMRSTSSSTAVISSSSMPAYFVNVSISEICKKIMLVWRELRKLKQRDTELTTIFKRLYEDNVSGTIPNEAFRKLSADYLVEQKEIQTAIPIKERYLDQLKATVADVGVFLEKARQYTEISVLTAELLHLFIERAEVGERGEKWSRTAPQEVHIY